MLSVRFMIRTNLFPAHAGVIRYISINRRILCTFPRTCGGDPDIDAMKAAKKDFSPHMRG